MAAEELADLGRFDVKLKAMKVELKAAVNALGSHLMDIHDIGPAGAARILADVADVADFLTATTAYPGGQPAAEPRAVHGRHRPPPKRHRRMHLLPAQAFRGQGIPGGVAVPETSPLRRGLPPTWSRQTRIAPLRWTRRWAREHT
jgi:transposase